MDQELREFLEQKFAGVDERLDARGRRVEAADARLVELRAYVDRGFETTGAALNGIRAYVDEKTQESRRHFEVVAEGLRGEIRLVAEGVVALDEKMDRRFAEVELAHREILAAIKFSYAELDRRMRVLESEVSTLKGRVDRIETRVG